MDNYIVFTFFFFFFFQGISWEDVDKVPLGGSISFSGMYGWLIADFAIYFLLALYLDNVMPSMLLLFFFWNVV